MGEYSQLASQVATGPASLMQSIPVGTLPTTTNEAINEDLNEWRSEQESRLGLQAVSEHIPAVAVQTKPCRSQDQFCHPVDRLTVTTNKPSRENTEQNIKPSITTSPTLSRAWLIRASPAHPREAVSDIFRSCDE